MKNTNDPSIEVLAVIFKFIFSWLMVLPAAVIISGKLLIQPIKFTTRTPQLLRIPLKIFIIEATDGEVILGFAAIFITLFLSGIFGGKNIYSFVKESFGIDPGQFHALFFFSALVTVIWAAILFLIHLIAGKVFKGPFSDDQKEYERRIGEIASRAKGIK